MCFPLRTMWNEMGTFFLVLCISIFIWIFVRYMYYFYNLKNNACRTRWFHPFSVNSGDPLKPNTLPVHTFLSSDFSLQLMVVNISTASNHLLQHRTKLRLFEKHSGKQCFPTQQDSRITWEVSWSADPWVPPPGLCSVGYSTAQKIMQDNSQRATGLGVTPPGISCLSHWISLGWGSPALPRIATLGGALLHQFPTSRV